MALQTLTGGLWLPGYSSVVASAPSFNASTIDAADEGVAALFRIPKTGNVAKVLWATRTTTTGATITVRGETVNESATPAIPSGTLYHANFTGTSVIANSDDNVPILTTLTGNAPVTIGDKIAIVIKQPNTSFGNMQIASFADDSYSFPHFLQNTGVSPAVSWANIGSATAACIGLEYDDGSYARIPGVYPLHTITSTTFANSSTPDEIGLRFKLPFPARIAGFWIWADTDGDLNVNLYDSDGATKIASTPFAIDKDNRTNANAGLLLNKFASTANLVANTYYRLVIEPSSATSLTMYDFTVNTAAVMDAFEGGQNFHLTSAKNPAAEGGWTNTTTRRPFMGVLLDAFDDGAGSGGLASCPIGGFVL